MKKSLNKIKVNIKYLTSNKAMNELFFNLEKNKEAQINLFCFSRIFK